MGMPVLILGESGSGKSTSLRNFDPSEVGVFNVSSKRLPFRTALKVCNNSNYEGIIKHLKEPRLNCYVIDDSQFLMGFEMFNRAQERGYDKFSEIGKRFYDLLRAIELLPDDVIVYLLHHVETTESGRVKAKTVGRMLDNHLTVESLFSVVLLCRTDGKKHWFETQTDGASTAKSPMGMFATFEIDNDLALVDDGIRQYWNLAPRIGSQPKAGSRRQTSQQPAQIF